MDLNKVILKVLNNEANSEEYEILEAWKKESHENIEFLEMLKENASESTLRYKDFDANKAWLNVDKKSGPKSKSNLLLYAACLAFLLVGAFWFTKGQTVDAPGKYIAEDGIIDIALQDDSQIWLNENSQLVEVSDFQTERRVSLKGEAFFNVAHDSEKPFIIEIGESEFIKVVGTSFNLINDGSEFDLAVYTGLVELHVLDRVIDVPKGKRVTLVNGSYVKVRNKENNLTSWKDRVLIFEDAPFKDVIDDLATHYDLSFNLAKDLTLNNCRLRSRFENQKIEDVLLELTKVFKMEYDYDQENRIIDISAIECN